MRRFWVCSIAFVIVVFFPVVPAFCQNTNAGHPPDNASNTVMVFMSDSQPPLKIETLWLKDTGNARATDSIYSAIARERDVVAVFHLGDITAAGSRTWQWQNTERQFKKLRQAKLPFYPVPGNHEYMFSPRKGLENFHKQFPEIKQTWYSVRTGPVAVVLLNSNFSQLSTGALSEQRQWYEAQLNILDQDPAIHAVIVATHYSPYTNSKVVSGSTEVQKEFVPLFQKCAKCRLFISGHAHAFEHFREQGKDFLVIGGGGGLLQPLRSGNDQKWRDLFPEKTEKRFFHYLTCRSEESGIEVSVKMLKADQSGFTIPYKFTVPLVLTVESKAGAERVQAW